MSFSSNSRLERILASPNECGRVLEADETVEINGQEYVILAKGVGATKWRREHLDEIKQPLHQDRLTT